MPGFVIHMAAAKEYLKLQNINDEKYINDFIIGSIAPDMASGNKKQSHFWSDFSYTQFVRKPDIEAFSKKYGERLNEPFCAGYFYHLFFDLRFLELYWAKHFHFLNDSLEAATLYEDVTHVRLDNGSLYARELFFSDEMYYGDYTRLNSYYIKKYKLQNFVPRSSELVIEAGAFDFYALKEKVNEVLNMKTEEEKPKVFIISELDELIVNTAMEAQAILGNSGNQGIGL